MPRIRIRTKTLAVPLICALLTGAVALAARDLLATNDALIQRLSQQELAKTHEVTGLYHRLSRNHVAIFDLLIVAERGVEEERVHEMGTPLLDTIRAVSQSVERLASAYQLSEKELGLTAELLRRLHAYREAVTSAIERASPAPADVADRFMGFANGRYTAMTETFGALVDESYGGGNHALRAVRAESRRKLARLWLVVAVTVTASGAIWFLLARVLTGPLLDLAKVMERVRLTGEYALRARRCSTDEVGDLADGFNAVLEQIHVRDRELSLRQDRLEALVEGTRQIARLQLPEALLDAVAESCTRLLEPDSLHIRVLEGDDLVLAKVAGPAEQKAKKRLKRGESISGIVAETGEPILISDPANDPRLVPEHRATAADGDYRALLVVPIKAAARVLGVLSMRSRQSRGFGPDDVRIAVAFASQVAVALENARLLQEVGTRERRLEALLDVSRQLSRLQSTESLLSGVAQACGHLLGTDFVGFRLVEGDGLVIGGMTPSAREALGEALIERLPLDRGLPGLVATTGEAMVVHDPAADPRVPPDQRDHLVRIGCRTWLGAPVKVGDRVVGVLTVSTAQAHGFSQDDLATATAFASQTAIALENARLYEGLTRTNAHLRVLFETARLVTVSRSLGEVLPRLVDSAVAIVRGDASTIRMLDPSGRFLILAAHQGLEPADVQAAVPIGEGVVGRAVSEGRPQIVEDLEQDERSIGRHGVTKLAFRSMASVPLYLQDAGVGTLSVFSRTPRYFSEDRLALLDQFANLAAIAISNKQAEETLRKVHAETEQLLTSISWILIAVDAEERVTRWNETAERTFGIPAEQTIGDTLAGVQIGWDAERALGGIRACHEREEPHLTCDEVRFTRPDGRDGFLSLTLSRIEGGGTLILGSDVSERKTLELQLAQAQKLESIGQLAAGVAHEINTPIQFVGDNVRFLRDAFADLERLLGAYQALGDAADPASALSTARAIEKATDVTYLREEIPAAVTQTLDGVDRVVTIVGALKQFAHPDRGEKEPADVNQLLLNTLTMARSEVKHVAHVETDLGELPPVPCYPGELNQAFLNLIVNAAHAIADVGELGRIEIATRQEGETAVITIRDTGGGIPEAIRDRIFDPFFTTKPVGRGSGQGLAIARAVVVNKHEGTLTFESETGQGTAFFIRLPLEPSAATEADGLSGPASTWHGRE